MDSKESIIVSFVIITTTITISTIVSMITVIIFSVTVSNCDVRCDTQLPYSCIDSPGGIALHHIANTMASKQIFTSIVDAIVYFHCTNVYNLEFFAERM